MASLSINNGLEALDVVSELLNAEAFIATVEAAALLLLQLAREEKK